MADIIILSFAVGLGLPQKIGIGNFVPIYLGVTNVLPILLTLFLHADRYWEYKEYGADIMNFRHSVTEIEQYDFIVVGGGAAGCVVANRLSRHFKVLLIERGGTPNPLTLVPGLDTLLVSRPETDYMFITEPQNSSCFSCDQRRSLWNQGRGLGGSGMLNSMVYLRGHPYDYDNWAHYTNDKRWKYKNILPYFFRSEDYCYECENASNLKTPTNGTNLMQAKKSVESSAFQWYALNRIMITNFKTIENFHATGGELPLMKPFYAPLVGEFLKAMSWANVQIMDQNAPFYYSAANIAVFNHWNSRRSSAFSSFIVPILGHRSNLHIWRYTQVIQVLLDGKNTAYAVKYERFGKMGIVKAGKEIIISSGAINSPKILLQSGIGPAYHLKRHKIPVRVDLPVGHNLQDHYGTLVGPVLIDKPLSYVFERDMTYAEVISFLRNGTGPFTIPFPAANAFWASTRAVMNKEGEWPDVQVGFAPQGVSAGLAEAISRGLNIRMDVLTEFFGPVVGRDAFFFIVNYARPKSRGRVKLRSTNHLEDPVVDPRYYTDPHNEDITVTVEALQEACYIAENAPIFKKLGARLSPVPFPPCKKERFKSASYWECVARSLTLTFHHYTGTCSLRTVVDSELRVSGTNRLRVIDSSVIPFVTSANTHAPTLMIGERGSDFVLEHWKNKIAQRVENIPEVEKETKSSSIPPTSNRHDEDISVELKSKTIRSHSQRNRGIDRDRNRRFGWEDPLKWFTFDSIEKSGLEISKESNAKQRKKLKDYEYDYYYD